MQPSPENGNDLKQVGVMDKSLLSLASVLQRRAWPALATFASVIGASIAYLVVTPSVYEVKGRLILDEKQVSVSELGRDLSQLSSHTPGGSSPLATQAEFIKSQRVLKEALNEVVLSGKESSTSLPPVKEFRKTLKVKLIPATNILELSYENEEPKVAIALLNTLLEVMVEQSRESIRSEAKSVREFLEGAIPKQREKAEAAEAALNEYRQSSGLVSIEEQTKSLVATIAEIQKEESIVAAQFEEANKQFESLQQIAGFNTIQKAYAGGRIGQDEALKQLRERLAQLDADLANGKSRFTDKHPAVISLQKERDRVSELYDRELARLDPGQQNIPAADVTADKLSQDLTNQFLSAQTHRLGLEKKLMVLQAERLQLQRQLDRFPNLEQSLSQLLRERDEAIESLKLLQNKLEEARIAEAQLVSNIRIIEQAELPSSPSGPKKKVVLVLAIAAGMVLAIGIMLLLEIMDRTLHESWEAEGLLELPMLGTLPDISVSALRLDAPDLFLDDVKLVEPYRRLLKTLEFRTQDKLRPIVVSSTVAGEGKSIVVSHLAAVSAMLSRRTLIIDADLHQPSQHSLFGAFREPGLTDAIANNVSLLELVQPTNIENLWVLSCGQVRSRAAGLLESPAMQSLLLEAAAHYDVTIVDTPPVNDCADAHALSRHSQGLVMVIRPNFTQKDILDRTVSELKANGVSVLGFVANQMSAKSEKYYREAIENALPPSKPLNRLASLEAPATTAPMPLQSVALRATQNGKQ